METEKFKVWKKGRGKLGLFDPLLGHWEATAESPQGKVHCSRLFQKTLADSYIQLIADWQFADKSYQEIALIGVDKEKAVCFWSFTSDGKQSQGKLATVTDVHAAAIGFEAQMPAGLARMVYWPAGDDGFFWAVESKTKNGWNRFVEHHYHAR